MSGRSRPRATPEFESIASGECAVGPHRHRGPLFRVSSLGRQRHLTVCEEHLQAGRDQLDRADEAP